MKTWIGIDNGISGAFALISETGLVTVAPTPTQKVGSDTRIDAATIYNWMHASAAFVCYEQGQKQPKFGCKGNFASGRSAGVIEAVCEIHANHHGLAFREVNPKTWQKVIFQDIPGWKDDTKAAAITFCRRQYPSVSLLPTPRCKKPHDGMADALCLAHYCRYHAFPA